MKKITIYTLLLSLIIGLSSCDKFLDIVPKGQVIPRTSSEYRALLTKGYHAFPRNKELLQIRGIQLNPASDPYGLSGFPAYKNIYSWQDTADTEGTTREFPYASFYQVIFFTNEVILNGANATQDSDESMDQIIAEAHILRAYSYFELANMYGPKYSTEARNTKVVPINTLIDTEQTLPRATLGEIYDLIESDLAEAEKLIKVDQWSAAQHKYRASREALLALASRVYLYKGEWQKSLDYSKKALEISTFLEDLNADDAQMPTNYKSAENIWALEDIYGVDLKDFTLANNDVYNSYDMEDLRGSKYFSEGFDWDTFESTITQGKFTNRDARATIRRSEIYLNAAEASARLGNTEAARSYLKTLIEKRYTAGGATSQISAMSSLVGEALVEFILTERFKEFVAEGHEWYDYKRTTQPALSKFIDGVEYHLEQGDGRYVLRLPMSAVAANPMLTE